MTGSTKSGTKVNASSPLRSMRATSISASNKKGARSSALSFCPRAILLRGRIGRSGRRGAGRRVGFKLLARFLSAFLQLFLQLLLGFLELLRIGRRTVIGLGEFRHPHPHLHRPPLGILTPPPQHPP